MDKLVKEGATVIALFVGLAILAVLVSRQGRGVELVQSTFSGLGGLFRAATNPFAGGGFGAGQYTGVGGGFSAN